MQTDPTIKKNRTGYYELRWSEKQADGTWRSRSLSTRTTSLPQARDFLKGWQQAQSQVVQTQPPTIDRLGELYLKAGDARITTRGQAQNFKWLSLFFGHLTPAQITAEHIADYTDARRSGKIGRKPAANGTIFKELTTLRTILRYGVKVKMVDANDIPYVDKPVRSQPRDVWLTEKEEADFLTLATQTSNGKHRMSAIHRFVWIALNTGARREAIESLRWEHVDLVAGTIDFSKTDKRMTKKRRVAVPISDRLMPLMKQAFNEKISEWVLDSDARMDWHFGHLVKGTKFEHISPHDLRRTCGTLMARAGVPLWEICGVLGDSMEVATRHYLHHSPAHLRSAINRVSSSAAVAAQGAKSAGSQVHFVPDSPGQSRSEVA